MQPDAKGVAVKDSDVVAAVGPFGEFSFPLAGLPAELRLHGGFGLAMPLLAYSTDPLVAAALADDSKASGAKFTVGQGATSTGLALHAGVAWVHRLDER